MRRDRQRLNDILEALDWIAQATGEGLKPISSPARLRRGEALLIADCRKRHSLAALRGFAAQ
jgi:hypothetical protein